MRNSFFLLLTIYFTKEDDGRWTAQCEELGTATFGDTLEEAQECIEEAIHLNVEGLIEAGEFENFLAEHKISKYDSEPQEQPTISAPIINNRNTFIQPQIYQHAYA